MKPYYQDRDGTVRLHLGDSLDILPTLPDASVDAVCTDPPYEISMMGKSWDSTGIAYNVDLWHHCWRILRPGGHLVAFGAPRTYHRLTCAIEDAGFEIRDSLHWVFGSGFPKGQDIAKSIDRRRDDRAQVLQVTEWLASARDAAGWTNRMLNDAFGHKGDRCSHWTTQGVAACVPTPAQWDRLRELLAFDDSEILPLVEQLNGRKGLLSEAWAQREVVGHEFRIRRESDVQVAALSTGAYDVTAPASEAARRWQGWNTNLKPAHEPIVLARKSTGFNTTVANVLQYGTGALNIDGCRTEAGQDYREKCASVVGIASPRNGATLGEWTGTREDSAHPAGRWPTDVLFGHGPDCVRGGACTPGCPLPELGGQARFFPVFRYEAKAPASERPSVNGIAHVSVKPLSLIRWLVRLVTPPGGTVLEPFAGSGTTLEACVLEGFNAIGVEREQTYADLCVARLSKPLEPALFGDVA